MNDKNSNFHCFLITGSNVSEIKDKINLLSEFDVFTSNHPDIFLLTSETSIGIEEIRNLQKCLSLKAYSLPKKIAVIFEAQKLTIEAQNALLKTLEEPPANSTIILTAFDTSWLLPTVVSRCLVIPLNQKINSELSTEEEQIIKDLIEEIIIKSIPKRFSLIDGLGISKNRETAVDWINKLTLVSRNILLSLYQNQEESVQTNPSIRLNILTLLSNTKKQLESNGNVRLVLEALMIDFPYVSS